MSQKTTDDLLDFGQDIKRMSADNITPPDTASKPREETTSTTTGNSAGESKTPATQTATGGSNIEPDDAREEQMRWRKEKSGGKE